MRMRLSKTLLTLHGRILWPLAVGCSLQMPKESDVFGGDANPSESAGARGYGDNAGGTNATSTSSNDTVGGAASPTGSAKGGTSASSTSSVATLSDALFAYFSFDEVSGAAAANSVDATRNAAYVGACTHPQGRLGGAVQLRNFNSNVSGSSDWVELPPGLLSKLSSVTIALWVHDLSPTRPGARAFDFSAGAGEQFYFSPHQTNTSTSSDGAHLVGMHAGTTFVDSWSTDTPFTDKQWHHVAVTWSAANLDWYLDGKRVAGKAAPGVVPSDLGVTTTNWLGRCLNDAFIAFYGEFDELRIYNRALSSNEIAQVYQLR
jgi:hypothetical protein